MAVRVKIRIERKTAPGPSAWLEVVALANSGFESDAPELVLPRGVAELLGLWPPPKGARQDVFESPAATFRMVTVGGAAFVRLAAVPGRRVVADAALSDRETEVVMNDALVEALRIELVAAKRGLYRVGPRGPIRRGDEPQYW